MIRGAILSIALALSAPGSADAQRTHLLVVTGLSGEAQYGKTFAGTARTLVDSARARWGVADSSIIVLGDTVVAALPLSGPSTRANIAAAFTTLSRRVSTGDVLLVFLNGHGAGEGPASRVGLPGPDATAADFAGWLAAFANQTVVFVNAASGSGDFAPVLAAPRRVVVTATRTAIERNESIFAPHFVDALTGTEADADKDGSVSVQEAFALATKEVTRVYESDNRLLTEHALLTDSTLARAVRFGPPARAGGAAVAQLATRRQGLYADVAALRARKAAMEPAAYERELETLLVDIAEASRAIRAAAGGTAR